MSGCEALARCARRVTRWEVTIQTISASRLAQLGRKDRSRGMFGSGSQELKLCACFWHLMEVYRAGCTPLHPRARSVNSSSLSNSKRQITICPHDARQTTRRQFNPLQQPAFCLDYHLCTTTSKDHLISVNRKDRGTLKCNTKQNTFATHTAGSD